MAGQLAADNPNLQAHLQALIHALQSHFGAPGALYRSMASIYGQLLQQSVLKAYVHDFRLLSVVSVICLLCVFTLKRVKRRPLAAAH